MGALDGTIGIMTLPKPPMHPFVEISTALQKLLKDEKYDELETIFGAVAKSSDPYSWSAPAEPYQTLAMLLAYTGGLPESFTPINNSLERWSEQRPKAIAPKVLLAERHILDGWKIRGGDFAGRVRPEAWKPFHERIAAARELLEPLLELEQPPPMAFQLLFQVAAAEGWDELKWGPPADQLRRVAPEQYEAHASMLMRLMPRWGGEPRDVNDYASSIADHVGGDKGDALYARLARAQLYYVKSWKAYEKIGFDHARVSRGWKYLATHGRENVFAANVGLQFAARYRDEASARDFLKVLDEYPGVGWEPRVWILESRYQAARNWALNGGTAQMQSDDF
jgi:hypothetical protein